MEYQIRGVHNHVEVYDSQGKFHFSADTYQEAWEELREMEQNMR